MNLSLAGSDPIHFATEPMKIDNTSWRCIVHDHWTGGRSTLYQWSDGSKWRHQREWPGYDSNRQDFGLPLGLETLWQKNKESINQALSPSEKELAEEALFGYPADTQIGDLYDSDEKFADALNTLIPDFEYPDYSHRTLADVLGSVTPPPKWLKFDEMGNPVILDSEERLVPYDELPDHRKIVVDEALQYWRPGNTGPSAPPFNHEEDSLPDWELVKAYFGLDSSFQYTDAHIEDYSRQYLDAHRSSIEDSAPFDQRETATILAALRYWQREGITSGGHEQDIATDGGELSPMTAAEIDRLCERVNNGPFPRGHFLETARGIIGDAMDQFEQMERMFRDDAEFMDVLHRMRKFQAPRFSETDKPAARSPSWPALDR